MEYHRPVLLEESVQWLVYDVEGVYVDLTFGGGGHSKKILEKLGASGRLFALDRDEDAHREASFVDDDRFTFILSDYRHLRQWLEYYGVEGVHGFIADLGVSSHQLDVADRGFSYRLDAPLDMRMSKGLRRTASDILNSYAESALVELFSRYGEVRNSRQLARWIVQQRQRRPFHAIRDFVERLRPVVRGKPERYWAQVFQALRIEVNDELGALKQVLSDVRDLLLPSGRLVVISYHSLEDRLVKNLIKTGHPEGGEERDAYGRVIRYFRPLVKGVIRPSEEEIAHNPRPRSAKMRVAERLNRTIS